MRASWAAAALVLLLALPGAVRGAGDWWEGVGLGEAQTSGYDECAAVYQVGLTRDGPNSWYTHVEVYAYPNRFEIQGCLPRGYVFPNVHGNPRDGWISTVAVPCAIAHVKIGPVGALVAGVAELYYYVGDYCNGHIDRGQAAMVFATPDV